MLAQLKFFKPVLYLFFIMVTVCSCQKYLDAKSDKKLVTPATLQDMQALLDSYWLVNQLDIGAGEVSADNYYLSNADWAGMTEYYQRMYLWGSDHLFAPRLDGSGNNWSYSYDNVYRANVVLDNLPGMARTTENQADWDNVKGQALFLRAKSFLQVAWIWSLAYDSVTAATDLGIPLRLTADFNIATTRSSVQHTYDQIIHDIKEAISLLPNTPLQVMRSAKPAALALLARAYLSMRAYDSCAKYADECLLLNNSLLDFNTLNASASYPVSQFNTEVIYESMYPNPAPLTAARAKMDTILYQAYATNDLRKTIFFRAGSGSISFKGSYEGGANKFSGIATDEVYLMRAECFAREGKVTEALNDLNTLMKTRWNKQVTYIPFMATGQRECLTLILNERRKELVMRGLRWMDIKRLNKEGANITLTRVINGQSYTLLPNDLRYALPIPEDIIQITGIQQNWR